MHEIAKLEKAVSRERMLVEGLNDLLGRAAAMTVDGFRDVRAGEAMLAEIESALKLSGRVDGDSALRQATADEIGKFVQALSEAFGHAAEKRSAGFFAMLGEDVTEMAPTIGALRAALKHLRRTSVFMPSIAEVVAALGGEAEVERGARRALERLPEHALVIGKMVEARNR